MTQTRIHQTETQVEASISEIVKSSSAKYRVLFATVFVGVTYPQTDGTWPVGQTVQTTTCTTDNNVVPITDVDESPGFYSTVVQSVMSTLNLSEGANVEICAGWLDNNARYHTTTQQIQYDYQKSLIDSINQLRNGVVSNASINTEKRIGMLKAIDSIFESTAYDSIVDLGVAEAQDAGGWF